MDEKIDSGFTKVKELEKIKKFDDEIKELKRTKGE